METMDLKAEASAPSDSRMFVRQVCSSWALPEDRIDIATLLASELVTNALQHTGMAESQLAEESACADVQLIGVRLVERTGSFVIEVWDASLKPPKLIEPAADSERGRGLQLVNALSMQWGYATCWGSKIVWCELSSDPAPETKGNYKPTTDKPAVEILEPHFWSEQA
jgi:anti-sigma regulatory factor (Ser/Thr protein kinase)